MNLKVMKIWSSAMDGHSCALCAKLEGQAVPLNKTFNLDGRCVSDPPLHDGCRCALIYDENPSPAPYRDFEAFSSFVKIANENNLFLNSVNAYHAAVFFLKKLSTYSDAELSNAGLSVSRNLKSELAMLIKNQDQVINGAIKRDYDRTVAEAVSLKTERGKKARLDCLLQFILSSQCLSPSNYEYLRTVFEG